MELLTSHRDERTMPAPHIMLRAAVQPQRRFRRILRGRPVRTVLVVDDDEGTRLTVSLILQQAGWSVSVADCGQSALSVIRELHPDVVLLDLRLPDMSGIDLLRKLSPADRQGTRIVLMTGFGTMRVGIEAYGLGAYDCVEKPLFESDLIRIVEKAFHTRVTSGGERFRRWAIAMTAVINSGRDVRTISEWGALISVSPETLREWCRTAQLRPKPSLDLARGVRAWRLALQRGLPAVTFLDAADRRTVERLVHMVGLVEPLPVSLEVLFRRQTFIRNDVALAELRSRLESGAS